VVEVDRIRVAFDVGGTFTDVVIVSGARVVSQKLLNGRSREALVQRIASDARALLGTSPVGLGVVHGTTVASNAVVEGTTARIGFIATRGFRDELEIRRLARPGIYDVMWQRPGPAVPRYLRTELTERTSAMGVVEAAVDPAQVEEVLDLLVDRGAEAVAICFLNSHVNPANEIAVAEASRSRGLRTTASHEIDREAGEFERSSTAAVNAALLEVVGDYLDEVQRPFDQLGVPFNLMQANGGLTTPGMARRNPVRLIESGPAAGVLAASALCAAARIPGAIAFDMGGTTVKACLIEEGRAVERSELEVGGSGNISSRYSRGVGFLVRTPAFDLVELGAGGGSLVWLDEDGLLRVGPRSAGAVPGPASYGRGGETPTVTDANVVLGYVASGPIGDGSVSIDRELACGAFALIAERLGVSLDESAFGALEVADATMTRALRAVSTERGRDSAELTLIAFGGGGPIHAARLAERTGIRRVLVPPLAGVYSAVGLQVAEMRFDFAQGLPAALPLACFDEIERQLLALEHRARHELGGMTDDSPDGDAWTFEHRLDLRYVEQSGSLTALLPAEKVGDRVALLTEAFESEHERLFGYRRSGVPLEVTSVRVLAQGADEAADLGVFRSAVVAGPKPAGSGRRDVYFGPRHGRLDVWCLPRVDLDADAPPLHGPGLVTEVDTTTVVPPGWSVQLRGDDGCLEVSRHGAGAA
jgi:N-methylhydantoinase A